MVCQERSETKLSSPAERKLDCAQLSCRAPPVSINKHITEGTCHPKVHLYRAYCHHPSDEAARQFSSTEPKMSLPNSIQISKAPKYSSWSRTKEYHIGTADAPLYTCKEVISWSGKFTLDLYSGSTTDGTSVANSTSGSLRKNEAIITIPCGSQSYGQQPRRRGDQRAFPQTRESQARDVGFCHRYREWQRAICGEVRVAALARRRNRFAA